jgi:hypothetical protein
MGDDRERDHEADIGRVAETIRGLLRAVGLERLMASRLRDAARRADDRGDALGGQVADAERDLIRLESEGPGEEVPARPPPDAGGPPPHA